MSAIVKSLITGGNPDERYPAPAVESFCDEDDPRIVHDFIKGSEIEAIAKELLRNRKCFEKIRWANIVYLWKREGGRSGGKANIGKCIKLSGHAKYFAGSDFLIWIGADWVRALAMTRYAVEAYVFHELKHATIITDKEGNKTPSIVPHDWEGFGDEIRFYGAYAEDIAYIGRCFQRNLFSAVDDDDDNDPDRKIQAIEFFNRTRDGDKSLGIIQPGMFSQNPVVGVDPASRDKTTATLISKIGGEVRSVTLSESQFDQIAEGGDEEVEAARSLLTDVVSNALNGNGDEREKEEVGE